MTDREAFEQMIKEDRYDQTTRLVFADWLDDHDCPEEADWQRAWTPEWQKAEDYVKDFCKRVDLNYQYFLEQARRNIEDDPKRWNIPCTLDTSNATMSEDIAQLWINVGRVLKLDVRNRLNKDPFTCGSDCFPDGLSWEDGDE